ncbi:hypothetical protein BC936DRAFT_148323 [Jimgerdemannia flammicorona]|uniref:Ketoreductase (KR) domain-containing protein n=1 Tax=Jimgerdemannia flammicorona TaxID=994334 RepID=A0A433D386_9FUNG|nr:hypothetical protein BC936DRAFT_148323 [Jimgerdemannia flammicorona]
MSPIQNMIAYDTFLSLVSQLKTMTLQHKVAIITGANTGIGFAIAERLLRDHCGKFTVVLACRNLKRAENAREKLSEEFPGSDIEIVQADMESVSSVFRACDDIKKRFTRLDLLFCNAGILLNEGLRWGLILRKIFTDIVDLFESDATIQRKGEMTADGLGKCFECNLFGHYLMVSIHWSPCVGGCYTPRARRSSLRLGRRSCRLDQLHDLREKVVQPGRLPGYPLRRSLRVEQVGYRPGLRTRERASEPAPCSLIHNGPGRRGERDRESGDVDRAGAEGGALHRELYLLVLGGIRFWAKEREVLKTQERSKLRLCGVTSQTITSANGSLSNVYVALAPPEDSLDVLTRYGSRVSRGGTPFVLGQHIDDYDNDDARELMQRMERLRIAFLRKEGRVGSEAEA